MIKNNDKKLLLALPSNIMLTEISIKIYIKELFVSCICA